MNSRFLDVFCRHVSPYSQNLVVVHHGEELRMEEGNGTEATHKNRGHCSDAGFKEQQQVSKFQTWTLQLTNNGIN